MTDDNDLASLELDVRTVNVFWAGDDAPEITIVGCSVYEALGLLLGAADYLRSEIQDNLEDEDDE